MKRPCHKKCIKSVWVYDFRSSSFRTAVHKAWP